MERKQSPFVQSSETKDVFELFTEMLRNKDQILVSLQEKVNLLEKEKADFAEKLRECAERIQALEQGKKNHNGKAVYTTAEMKKIAGVKSHKKITELKEAGVLICLGANMWDATSVNDVANRLRYWQAKGTMTGYVG